MKVLIDMNLSPTWCGVLERHGHIAVHWSHVGDPRADDATLMAWARENGHIVFTHDLDFGTILALTHASGPSVIQVRTQDVMPPALEDRMVAMLQRYEAELTAGALLVVDESKARVRILPFQDISR